MNELREHHMGRLRFIVTLVWLLASARTLLLADEQPPSAKPLPRFSEVQLTFSGRVLRVDGAPAVGAVVKTLAAANESPASAITNGAGQFQIKGIFSEGLRLYASSPDGSEQVTLFVSANASRKVSATPIELKLQPAVSRKITVLAQDKLAAGVLVVATGYDFSREGVTGSDGKVVFPLPAGKAPESWRAWHPQLGIAGRYNPWGYIQDFKTLSLIPREPSNPYSIQVLDPYGRGVDDLELGIQVRRGVEDFMSGEIAAARVRTSNGGKASVPWIPRSGVIDVSVQLLSSDWKLDAIDNKSAGKGITRVKVCRLKPLLGRLIMPKGANPEGILVMGMGYGREPYSAKVYARMRRDGWFTLNIPDRHVFVLEVNDLEWAATHWVGTIRGERDLEEPRITLKAYPAVPVTVRVTRGPNRKPVVDAWVLSWTLTNMDKADDFGDILRNLHGRTTDFRTDANGELQLGVERGIQAFSLSTGIWGERQVIDISADKPAVVEFHHRHDAPRIPHH